MSSTRGAKVEVCCEWCRKQFAARIADRKRGWARYCSKVCKATEQEKRTGANAAFVARQHGAEEASDDDQSWDAHKDWFGKEAES